MEKVIVFGMGERFEYVKKLGYLDGIQIIAYSDNNKEKWGEYDGIEVIPPDKISSYPYEKVYVATSFRYYDEIKNQLMEQCKVPEDKIDLMWRNDEKYQSELGYWKDVHGTEARFQNGNGDYRDIMLGIAQEPNDEFWKGKVVADFGCGPQGSLTWTKTPSVKLGIDVLASQYLENFGDELIGHDMIYVTSSEERIPIPDEYVDVLCTINSLDHVVNLDQMISEILRILKPGGTLLGSFNLYEPRTGCEPQTLTENILSDKLFKHFKIYSSRMIYKDEQGSYQNLIDNNLIEASDGITPTILWVRAEKKKN